jgi:hypothetical protein
MTRIADVDRDGVPEILLVNFFGRDVRVLFNRGDLELRPEIDVSPGRDPNPIHPGSRRPILVAILGSETFDVDAIDRDTLAFGPDGASPRGHGGFGWDVNGDGFTDLVSRYRTRDTGIAMGDAEACVTGATLAGIPFTGCDDIVTRTGCGLGYELAVLLPVLVWTRGRRRSQKRN